MSLYLPNGDPFLMFLREHAQATVRFFPHSGNMGDGLITYATLKLFEHFGINYTTHRQDARFDNELVFIGGGGNMIEGRYEDVAKLIWDHRESNKVVLLPQTIVGYDDIIKEVNNNLTIFCREETSFQHCLKIGGYEDRVHLCHDAALYLDVEHFAQRKLAGSGRLSAMRTDAESLGPHKVQNNIDISLAWNGDVWTSPSFTNAAVISMAEFVSQYAEVKTDRLHVAIISALLGRSVTMHPNDYFKNRAVFEHSLQERFEKVVFVDRTVQSDFIKPIDEIDRNKINLLQKKLDRERDLHNSTRRKFRLEIKDLSERVSLESNRLHEQILLNDNKSNKIKQLVDDISSLKEEIRRLESIQDNSIAPLDDGLEMKNYLLQEHLEILLASKSWKYTRIFRKLRSFF
ncbi:polysaccharide pyruvyl transferase family protein [Brucella anthropi]|uniref:polysaccharide pyruvyl transferase family protein n=1 Tax=Brucella anthropi TaxID=529 RepID=UPI001E2E3E9D|nr:polysaccharide pyruvyl transferase family protein [Brucella anthropi]UGQ21723.1 polysaccharide pyruvyl transferase family protein [Brucella anthropi]